MRAAGAPDAFFLFCSKIGVHMAGELFARRTVLSKPLPAISKMSRSFFSFSITVLPSINELMWDRWLTYAMWRSWASGFM